MSTWQELQNKLQAYQSGQSLEAQAEPVRINNNANASPMYPVAPPPIPEEERAAWPEEQPVFIGRDLMGVRRDNMHDYRGEAGAAGWGENPRLDSRSGYQPGANLEDIRAREQSTLGKIVNGALKGAVTAGTIYADTTVGTIAGALRLFSPVYWALGRDPLTGQPVERQEVNSFGDLVGAASQAMVDTPISNQLNKWQRAAEDILPNYRTEAEQSEEYQRNWYRPSQFFSANNIGDGILKNFGFTVGAMLGGSRWSKILGFGEASKLSNNVMRGVSMAAEGDAAATSALKSMAPRVGSVVSRQDGQALARNIEKVAKGMNMKPFGEQLTGSILAAIGEGRAEGLMAREEFLEEYFPQLDTELDATYRQIERDLLGDTRYSDEVEGQFNPDGTPVYVLNGNGEEEMLRRKNEAFQLYQQKRQYALQQADDIASYTFALNMIILTPSNFFQFGKMLGGGWKTARKNATRLGGGVRFENGVPVGAYTGATTAGTIARGVGSFLKVPGSEAAEEMLQGVASSGMKAIAEDKLTAFKDLSFDPNAINSLRDQFASFVQGGADYLGDVRNWQEGALGALTGLFGMPGRGYFRGERGGIPAVIAETRAGISEGNQAAEKLNNLVNSKEFRDRWNGWVRHLAYKSQAENAVAKDDEYAYHTADDNQLINDIITFSKEGRLDDLYEIADRFSNLSGDDVAEIRDYFKQADGYTSDLTNAQIKERVEKQANNIKQAIKDYGGIATNIEAMMPIDASDDILNEVIFTANQIDRFEKRFLTLLGETIDELKPYFDSRINTSAENYDAELKKMQQDYASIFNGSLVPITEGKQKETQTKLESLKNYVKGMPQLQQKVNDMIKLSEGRQKFFEKIQTLRNMTNEEFNEKAQSEEKVVSQAEKEAAAEELAAYTSFEAVREAYNRENKSKLGDVSGLIGRMRKGRGSNQHVDAFLKTLDARDKIKGQIRAKYGITDNLSFNIVDSIFDSARGESEMLNPLSVPSYDNYIQAEYDKVKQGNIDTLLNKQNELSAITGDVYMAAADKVVDAINTVRGVSESVSGRKPQDAKKPNPEPSTKRSEDSGKEPSQPSSVAPDPKTPDTAVIADDMQSAIDKKGERWAVGETVYGWDSTKQNPQPIQMTVVGFKKEKNDVKMIANDGRRDREISLNHQLPFIHHNLPEPSSEVQQRLEEESRPVFVNPGTTDDLAQESAEAYVPQTEAERKEDQDKDENGDKLYYQAAIPEFPVHYARELREAKGVDARKNVIKKIKDLVTEVPAFKYVYEYLSSDTHHAFRNTVKELKKGDKISFITPADLELFDGKPQIIMAIERDGQMLYLNLMRDSGMYHNLDKFWEAYMKEYNDFIALNPNQDFKFSKQSTVRTKRGGVIVYDYSPNFAGERKLDSIEEYDESAPIVWFNREGQIETLRGDRNAGSSVYSWRNLSRTQRNERRGNFYYMADDGLGGYLPIRLNIEHFKPDTDPELGAVKAVKSELNDIAEIAQEFFDGFGRLSEQQIAKLNNDLHDAVAELKTSLNLGRKDFALSVGQDGPVLRMINVDRKGNTFDVFALTPDTLGELEARVAQQKMSFNLKPENIKSFIEQGLITSNAKKLLPQNVDFYIEPWEENDFRKPEEEPAPQPVQNFYEEEEDEDLVFESSEPDDDLGFEDQFMADVAAQATIDTTKLQPSDNEQLDADSDAESAWEALSAETKANLEHQGIGKEDFDDMAPEDQDYWRDCAGA